MKLAYSVIATTARILSGGDAWDWLRFVDQLDGEAMAHLSDAVAARRRAEETHARSFGDDGGGGVSQWVSGG